MNNKELAKEIVSRMDDALLLEINQALNERINPRIFDYKSIKTVEDAFKHLGLNEEYIGALEEEEPDEQAYRLMKTVIKAINPSDWRPKFDGIQKNWYCYWSVRSVGSGFSFSFYGYVFTGSFVGSRLLFANKERANHFGKYFAELAKKFYL